MYGEARKPLLIAADQDGGTISVDRSDTFKNFYVKYEEQLKGINEVTIELQRQKDKLSDCRMAIDVILDAIELK